MKKAERFRKEIVLLFPVFLVFPDKAQGKSGNFSFPIFAYYTTTREKGELRPALPCPSTAPGLYHYKRKRGTTTRTMLPCPLPRLYHYKRKRGTTTTRWHTFSELALYHYKRKGELRLPVRLTDSRNYYTTTREKGELRHFGAGRPGGRPPVPCRRRREHGPGGTCPA